MLSSRVRAELLRRQRRIMTLTRELQKLDGPLAGTLAACDASTQRDALADYLEVVQELRAGLQQLEGFLLPRLVHENEASEEPESR